LVAPDGSARALPAGATLDALGEWRSPRSGGRYPSGWRLEGPSPGLGLTITPYVAPPELSLSTLYWVGAVKIESTSGGVPIGGSGYVELTGYGEKRSDVQVR